MSKTETAQSTGKKIEEMEVTGEPGRMKKIETKIIEDAEEKAKNILREAEKDKKDTIDQKKREGELESERIIRRGTEEADSLKMQKVAEARLKGKQMIMASRDELINHTMEKIREKLLELTGSKGYTEVLQKLIEEGGLGLGGGELEVIMSGKSAKTAIDLNSIASHIEKETGKKTSIRTSQEKTKSISGVIVRKADGSITIDNTFEGRIERTMRDIRIRMAKLLFE